MNLGQLIGVFRPLAVFAIAMPVLSVAARGAITISSKPTVNITCSDGVCTPTAKKAVLNVDDLANILATGNATVKSTSLAQDIEIGAKLSWASTNRLTLDAYRSVRFDKPVEAMGAGSLTISTNDGGTGGDFLFADNGRVRFSDAHSRLNINGQNYRLFDSLKGFIRALRHTDGAGQFFAQMDSWNIKQHWSLPPINKSFSGTFEGLGNTISNLVVNNSTSGGAGLFYSIDFGGLVRDVRLENASVSGGAIGSQFVGALAAGNDGTIVGCFASGHVSTPGASSFVGGLVGGNDGMILRSGSAATVSGEAESLVGGLTGENISGGGVLGNIDQSYSTGAVAGGDGSTVGGLVGYNFGAIISNSYATGTVLGGNNTFVGGLIGTSAEDTDDRSIPAVSASYSTGAVSGGSDAMVGGLIGSDAADAKDTNLYWDMDTSGVSDSSKGAGNIPNDPGITGLSDAQLKSGLPAGFDKKVWKEKAKLDSGYPYLIDNPPPT